KLMEDRIEVPGSADRVGTRVATWLKLLARDRLIEASDRYAAELGRPYTRLSLRDTRSRWGSCSAQGRLMYSWRLILAPPEALDYVAAHEVAHLQEMNHSPAFWSIVADLCPDYETQRLWLRHEGTSLHRYRFGN
ncbi:MAG: SprT family zinc-dependent metalloprotease, partial [Pseudomonadota bacterium]